MGGTYQVVGNWTDFRFQDMTPSPSVPGLWEFHLQLTRPDGDNVFVITRDEDMHQVFYPEIDDSDDPATPILGPDDQFGGRCWMLKAPAGTLVLLKWQRSVSSHDGDQLDLTGISWTFASEEPGHLDDLS